MATGSYLTPNYSRSQSEIQGDLHTVIVNLTWEGDCRNTRENISSNIVRSWNVYNICGELRDEIQSPQLREVHLLWHNQRRPHEEQAGRRCRMSKKCSISKSLFTPLKCCNCLRRPV
ncbi:hypothetical protein TNCV_4344801 [Trichonephila clavipes]|nr:hypothetical protein TNCV_4344801 [Trichonephila clavipes]